MATITKGAVTGTGYTSAISPRANHNQFQAVLQVNVGTTATYTVEFSCDGTNYFSHPEGIAQSASGIFTFDYPVTLVRINVTAVTGTLSYALLEA